MRNNTNDNRPKGSGILVLIFGIVLLFTGAYYSISNTPIPIDKDILLKVFLIVNGILLMIWAIERLYNSKGGWFRVGRDTIQFLIAVISAIIAIMALVN
ncbi:hypothetical protein [Aquimarina litoralis]|uniref:hypothetical protein n=1 Tax=Aquimarina litoralis TaxID=584605 RepID=UPI001C562FAB|nr:hypothetical protein [Aquimarina litoralis]MBW1296010.1 hypothetical protein [Aquimarina litoralis]